MTKNNRLLRNYIIYPSFQWKLVFFIMLICMITPLSLFVFQEITFQSLFAEGLKSNLPDSHPYFVFLLKYQDSFQKVMLLSLGGSLILVFIFGILLTHRVAGPLVKMRNFFIKVANEPLLDREIGFRNGDYFQDLAEAYNKRFKK